MKARIIRAVVKRVGQAPEVKEISWIEEAQEIVGGYVETAWVGGAVHAIVNEEGKLRELPFNCCGFVGDFLLVRMTPTGKVVSLTDEDIRKAKLWLEAGKDVQPDYSGFRVLSGAAEIADMRRKMAEDAARREATWVAF